MKKQTMHHVFTNINHPKDSFYPCHPQYATYEPVGWKLSEPSLMGVLSELAAAVHNWLEYQAGTSSTITFYLGKEGHLA